MAREFDGSNQYLTISTPAAASLPITMACWFYAHSVARNDFIITISENGSLPANRDFMGLRLRGGVGGDPVRALSWSGSSAAASTTTGFSVNTWHHGCAVFAASNDRRVYIDGGSKGTDTTEMSVVMHRTNIACVRREDLVSDLHDGIIAEVGIWNEVLSDEEVAVLALGVSPLLVRPASCVLYLPLIRDDDEDLIGGLSFTAVNAPTIAAHSRVFYIAPPALSHITLVVGEVTWGHDTGVIEANVLDFAGNWAGTGEIISSGDDEQICLDVGEYMESGIVDTGAETVTLYQNLYDGTGDDVTLRYRHGATPAACVAAAWNNYTVPFVSAGYVQVRLEAT